jgi:hypothetical protein
MKRLVIAALLLSLVATPSFCKTHKEVYSVSCSTLWPAIKDVLRNSGKYEILGTDNTELTASYVIGGTLTERRINSLMLNARGDGCGMQIQTAYSGLGINDEGDFKKRVDKSLAKLRTTPPVAPPTAPAPAHASAPFAMSTI